jgi:hypothetical protein
MGTAASAVLPQPAHRQIVQDRKDPRPDAAIVPALVPAGDHQLQRVLNEVVGVRPIPRQRGGVAPKRWDQWPDVEHHLLHRMPPAFVAVSRGADMADHTGVSREVRRRLPAIIPPASTFGASGIAVRGGAPETLFATRRSFPEMSISRARLRCVVTLVVAPGRITDQVTVGAPVPTFIQ